MSPLAIREDNNDRSAYFWTVYDTDKKMVDAEIQFDAVAGFVTREEAEQFVDYLANGISKQRDEYLEMAKALVTEAGGQVTISPATRRKMLENPQDLVWYRDDPLRDSLVVRVVDHLVSADDLSVEP